MEFNKNNMAFFSPELDRDLVELMELQEKIGFRQRIMIGPTAGFPGEEKVGGLLTKTREIVKKYHPQSFAISIGFPFGAQVSFTWQT